MADYQSSHSGPTIDTRVSQVATNTADIAALKSRMNAAESEIDTKADATSVTALSSQIGGVEAKIPSAATTSNKLADKAYVDASTSGKASQSDLTNLTNRVTAVEDKIPSNASSSNQLADKSFVNVGLSGKQATLVSGSNIATINGQSLLNGGNIVAGDPNAVKYVAQSLTESQKSQARTNIGVSERIENQQDNDFAIADENDFDIVQFKNGEVKTKNFDSAKAPYSEIAEDGADFEVNDANGFAILRCIDGHIKTKNFDSSSPLSGKKVAFLGDSIIAGYNASPTTKRFSTRFCELAGCTEKNLGVAGTCIANNTLNGLGSTRFIARATSENLSGQDLIFVFGGTNDFSYDSKPIGEPFDIQTITPDTYIGDKKKTAPSDTDTFSGALHELILQIRSVAPSAQLVFITPLTRGRYNAGRPTSAECNQHGDFLQDFTDTIKTVCSFYSVPVVDMGVMMNQFWANDGNGTFGSYDDDGLHPNNAGHERIAKLLYKWVNHNLIF